MDDETITEQQIGRLHEQLRIAEEALEYILSRGYTGAAYVAQEALKEMAEAGVGTPHG